MNRMKLANNLPLFYLYQLLNSFILDRGIWMLFLLSKGFTLAEIAMLESGYHCIKFVLEVPTGYLADRYGKRISLLLAQIAGVLSASLLLWGNHWLTILLGFMLGGLVGTFQSGATSALIYDTLKVLGKEEAFKRQNSYLSAVVLISMGLSGAVGGGLSDINWAWVYFGKIGLHSLTLVVAIFLVEPTVSSSQDLENEQKTYSFRKQLGEGYHFMKANVSFLSISVFGATLYSMSWSISFYSQVVFQSVGLNNKVIGLLNGLETWVAAGIVAVAFIGERRFGQKGSILISGFGFILFLITFSTETSPRIVIASFFMMSIVVSYIEPLMDAYLNELLPSHIRATMLSVFSMLVSAGMIITFSVIGFLADWIGLSNALKLILFFWVPVCVSTIFWSLKYAKKRAVVIP